MILYLEVSNEVLRVSSIARLPARDTLLCHLATANGGIKQLMYYNYEVTPWIHLAGDVQYIQSGSADLSPTVVMGLRLVTDF